ncbi:ABC transporter ATP-binding protein [Paenibacillus koleovorans]|uniref:ABC transporter ATP-binding protein n=1 Tax=Paenibacillus koleovorans TaxID=121608 RepID=UPI000FDC61A9|nr:ATP-binding cassette domain-containing protein [Paenibacillus koleovorans]
MWGIRVRGLSKSFQVKRKQSGLRGSWKAWFHPEYNEKIAVQPIDLDIERGDFVAFLGPNGAGKSTTIKMLTGILHPTAGTAEVLGHCPWKERSKLAFRIGTVFGQKSQLWYHLPPMDTFELMSRIYEIGKTDYIRRRDDLIERFELQPYLTTPVRKLSLGERMRCEMAAALLHRPELVFLDEPTIGLDVVVKLRIRELLLEMNRQEGTTLFLTSHDAGDVEQLCRRAIVVNHGTIILDDRVANLKRNFLTRKTINLRLREPGDWTALRREGVELLAERGTEATLSVDTSRVTIETVLADIVGAFRLEDVTIEDPPMEQIITRIYEHTSRTEGIRSELELGR